jgi:hypothetical protein
MSISRKPRFLVFGSLALALIAGGTALAQDSMSPQDKMGTMASPKEHMKGMHSHMMGKHTMPATVTSVDAKTGLVEVDSEGMALKVHFPPSSVADLKTGDKITLHLGFSKP